MQGYLQYLNDDSIDRTSKVSLDLKEFFGNLLQMFWTLIGVISGGVDWLNVKDPIEELGTMYVIGLLLYVIFVLFGLMNILTGIFVNAATQAAQMNREIAIDNAMANKAKLTHELVNLFLECDADQNNKLTWDELQEKFRDERIKAYFISLDLDSMSVCKIFEILDTSQLGVVDLDEFVQGCMTYRGNAKAVDISILQSENTLLMERIETMLFQVKQLGKIVNDSTGNSGAKSNTLSCFSAKNHAPSHARFSPSTIAGS